MIEKSEQDRHKAIEQFYILVLSKGDTNFNILFYPVGEADPAIMF